MTKLTTRLPSDVAEHPVMNMTLKETSNLRADNNVVHPFLRVHLVEFHSGTYLQKDVYENVMSKKRNLSVYQHENRTHAEKDVNQNKKVFSVILRSNRVIPLNTFRRLQPTLVISELWGNRELYGTNRSS